MKKILALLLALVMLFGVLADRIGLQHAFFLPLLCYVYIAFYGLRGSRIRSLPTAGGQADS